MSRNGILFEYVKRPVCEVSLAPCARLTLLYVLTRKGNQDFQNYPYKTKAHAVP